MTNEQFKFIRYYLRLIFYFSVAEFLVIAMGIGNLHK